MLSSVARNIEQSRVEKLTQMEFSAIFARICLPLRNIWNIFFRSASPRQTLRRETQSLPDSGIRGPPRGNFENFSKIVTFLPLPRRTIRRLTGGPIASSRRRTSDARLPSVRSPPPTRRGSRGFRAIEGRKRYTSGVFGNFRRVSRKYHVREKNSVSHLNFFLDSHVTGSREKVFPFRQFFRVDFRNCHVMGCR